MQRIRETLASWLERLARRLRGGGGPIEPLRGGGGPKEPLRGGGGPIEPL